jgi:hypothetical protein
MSIAEAFQIDSKDLIVEAENRRMVEKKGAEKQKQTRDAVIRLDEMKNGHSILGYLSKAEECIDDLPSEMTAEQGKW